MENFGFTIQIPAFLKVNYVPSYKIMYSGLSEDEQKDFITTRVNTVCMQEDRIIDRDLIFEKHKDGRIHAHGTFKNILESEILCMQHAFCLALGIKRQKQQDEIFNWIRLYDSDGWTKYTLKDNPIPPCSATYGFKGKKPYLTVEF